MDNQLDYMNHLTPEIKSTLSRYIELRRLNASSHDLTTWLDNIFNTAPELTHSIIVYNISSGLPDEVNLFRENTNVCVTNITSKSESSSTSERTPDHTLVYLHIEDSCIPISGLNSNIYRITVPSGTKILPIGSITGRSSEILLWNKGKLIVTNSMYQDSYQIFDTIYIPSGSIELTPKIRSVNVLKMRFCCKIDKIVDTVIKNVQGSNMCTRTHITTLVKEEVNRRYGYGAYPLNIIDDSINRILYTNCMI